MSRPSDRILEVVRYIGRRRWSPVCVPADPQYRAKLHNQRRDLASCV